MNHQMQYVPQLNDMVTTDGNVHSSADDRNLNPLLLTMNSLAYGDTAPATIGMYGCNVQHLLCG